MKSLLLNGRMAVLRKTSCLLTVLFSLVATVFLLIYPLFVENTRAQLEHAYDTIQVSGWIFNSKGFEDPYMDGALWNSLLDTGHIGAHYTHTAMELKVFDKPCYQGLVPEDPSAEELTAAFDVLIQELGKHPDYKYPRCLLALSHIDANDTLSRRADEIRWMEGRSPENFFTEDAPVCLVADNLGFQPGDLVPLRIRHVENKYALVCLQVVGVYPRIGANKIGDVDAILPIRTLENLFRQQEEPWDFWVNGFSFLVKENRELPALKKALHELKLTGGKEDLGVRAAIDDRILDGTVSPIKSNLSMLEGLYRFFFLVVAAIGFFLCFLLAKGRKQEYAVMRLLGESAFQVTWKAILEQLLLCLAGIAAGALLLLLAGLGTPNLATCGIILVCYTLGAAIAVMLTVCVNVMEILRDKE